MLDKNLVNDVLTAALATGGDLAEVFVENSVSENINMVNKQVEKANWSNSYGLGLRVIYGTSAVYAYTSQTTRDSLLKLAQSTAEAVKAAVSGNPGATTVITAASQEKLADSIKISPDKAQKSDIVQRLRQACEASYAYDALITQTSNSYTTHTQDVLIANSKGVWVEDHRVNTRVAISAVASQASEKQSGTHSPGAKMGYEFVEGLNLADLGQDAARIAVTMLKADLCPSGKMPVIIDNGFGGVIFHEACAHSIEATSVAKKASVFTDKLGETIAATCVNAVDDGTLVGEWGSINIDDEGNPTRRNVLIENGVLKSFLIDHLNGLKMGMPSTGSARRQNYKFAPTSRMTNTYILPGENTVEQIISATDYGLYAAKMGGGSVNPSSGDFNFAVLEGYMIRNGKIAEPVRGATLIGKGHEVLFNIDMVADNFAAAQGVCGSLSGGVPTNVGQPMIRVKEMTVGGRK